MSPRIADRMNHIEPFHVMALLARAKELEAEGHDVIHMEIGEPDFPTPRPIVEAGRQALADGHTFYTPALGIAALRETIAGFYQQHYGVAIDPARVVVTPGASGALQLALGVLINPGDEILLADPTYPCNRHFIRMFEGVPHTIAVGPQHRFQLTAEQVREHWNERTAGVMLASPANPTGTLVPAAEMRAIAAEVRQRRAALIVDEIYQGLVYEQPDATVLTCDGDAFVINSFSKYFQMTGWRLGWLIAPEPYLPAIEKLAMNVFLSASAPAQYAALAAFTPETRSILEARRAEFRVRRDYLVQALQQIGLTVPVQPDGAFYVYADCSALAQDSETFARELLEAAHVAVTPGRDFGGAEPGRYLRFAYTTSIERMGVALDRISRFVSSNI
ncbi:pyridoxal phosphate-dependent aminotransferase [Chitinivorax sp. PXF-14]|uniref:pyridoxal phosphate-dependent aminotransferase n=1 Tax=Chitinivorax sp. PXF-14 TaxID=3230488 RepID=UPI0034671207